MVASNLAQKMKRQAVFLAFTTNYSNAKIASVTLANHYMGLKLVFVSYGHCSIVGHVYALVFMALFREIHRSCTVCFFLKVK